MSWTCEKCGSCCAIVGCSNLTTDRLCSIYDTRPDVCRVTVKDQTKGCHDCREQEKANKKRGIVIPKRTIEQLLELQAHYL